MIKKTLSHHSPFPTVATPTLAHRRALALLARLTTPDDDTTSCTSPTAEDVAATLVAPHPPTRLHQEIDLNFSQSPLILRNTSTTEALEMVILEAVPTRIDGVTKFLAVEVSTLGKETSSFYVIEFGGDKTQTTKSPATLGPNILSTHQLENPQTFQELPTLQWVRPLILEKRQPGTEDPMYQFLPHALPTRLNLEIDGTPTTLTFMGSILGSGNFSVAARYADLSTPDDPIFYALKFPKKTATQAELDSLSAQMLDHAYKIKPSSQVSQPDLVGLPLAHTEVYIRQGRTAFALPLSLEQELIGIPLQDYPAFSTVSSLSLFLESLIKAAAYLHSKGIAHMDIHPGNVLIKEGPSEFTCSLVDLGNSGPLKDPTVEGPVFISNLPPEIIDSELASKIGCLDRSMVHRQAWDIWATGVTALEQILKQNVFKWSAEKALQFASTQVDFFSPQFATYYANIANHPDLKAANNAVGRVILGLLLSTATPTNRTRILANLCTSVTPELVHNLQLLEMCGLVSRLLTPIETRSTEGFPRITTTTSV